MSEDPELVPPVVAAPSDLGHAETRRALIGAVQRGRLAHALLLAGEEGVGKADLALWLVRLRWCTADPAPCGVCPTCRKVITGNHPDVGVLRRAEGDTAIGVDRVRGEVVDQLAVASTEGRGRVVVVVGADELNEEAQNALLKTLEEPPRDGLLILVTAHEERLLDTVRSRCQEVRVQPLADDELVGLPDVDPLLARLCRGRPGRLAAWADLDLAGLLGDIDGWLAGSAPGAELAARLAAHAEADAHRVLEVLGARVRDLALVEAGLDSDGLLLPEPPDAVKMIPFEGVARMQEAVLEAGEDLRRHLQPVVVWAALGIEFAAARVGGRPPAER